MKIFNSMTMQKEEFVPIQEGKVRMYACGPTVYNYIHVGNARPMIMFDVLRRYLEFCGYEVTFVQNFTDVDDKIINRANEEQITCLLYTSLYSRAGGGDNRHGKADFGRRIRGADRKGIRRRDRGSGKRNKRDVAQPAAVGAD